MFVGENALAAALSNGGVGLESASIIGDAMAKQAGMGGNGGVNAMAKQAGMGGTVVTSVVSMPLVLPPPPHSQSTTPPWEGVAEEAEGHSPALPSHYREAVRIDPLNAKARHNLGVCLVARGELEQAAAQFREALRLNPNDRATRESLERVESQLR